MQRAGNRLNVNLHFHTLVLGSVAGRLLPGRQTDVFVVRGDPTRDITDLWKVLDAYQAGRRIERGVT